MKYLFVSLALIVALALTGCSFGLHDGSMDLAGVRAEYEMAARSLSWPVGSSWRSAEMRYPPDEEPTTYEVGYGVGDAESEWLCAWDSELLDAVKVDSESRKEAAFKELAKMSSLPGWKYYDDGAQELLTKYLVQAHLGDFSEFASYAAANCNNAGKG